MSYSWGLHDKYSSDIDLELQNLKGKLNYEKSQPDSVETNTKLEDFNSTNSLDNVERTLQELNNLIGLEQLKLEIKNLINFL